MTTIACNHEMIAADSQSTHNGLICKEIKIFRTNNGLVGMAGDSQEGLAFLNWFNGGDKPDVGEEFEAIALTPKGDILWYGHRLIPEKITSPYYAIGSGSHVAIGAMCMGASPKEAVQHACKWTHESCLPVKTLSRE
jgi:hypothetical protein